MEFIRCKVAGCNFEHPSQASVDVHVKACHTGKYDFVCRKCSTPCGRRYTCIKHIERRHPDIKQADRMAFVKQVENENVQNSEVELIEVDEDLQIIQKEENVMPDVFARCILKCFNILINSSDFG